LISDIDMCPTQNTTNLAEECLYFIARLSDDMDGVHILHSGQTRHIHPHECLLINPSDNNYFCFSFNYIISKLQMTKNQILNPYTSESESTIVCHRKLLYAKQQVHQCECELVCLFVFMSCLFCSLCIPRI
jgi:hypothetical protein